MDALSRLARAGIVPVVVLVDVVGYGGAVTAKGLDLLCGPGNRLGHRPRDSGGAKGG